ncbi:hypothetical protein JI59_08545 [Novosphingobium pentaromativorans US6-1]|nr:hypothetical protein JI59_08545 [Novosphingobium pentaromativorans US6-1]
MVFSDPKPGCEDEYNQWYNDEHIGDVLNAPGFVAARRFRIAADPNAALPHRYVAIYEMETDDPDKVMAELTRRSDQGVFQISSALDLNGVRTFIAEEIHADTASD